MATRAVNQILRRCLVSKPHPSPRILQSRYFQLSMDSGAIPGKPASKSFGLLKVILFTVPFVYIGSVMSREGAAWLEENEIFSPEDDD